MSDEYHKCDRKSYCKTMLDRSESVGNAKSGLIRMSAMDMSGTVGNASIIPIGITHKINTKDRGLMLNNCPWCGNSIDFFRRDQAEEPKEKVNV
jgi:hypothetical protein